MFVQATKPMVCRGRRSGKRNNAGLMGGVYEFSDTGKAGERKNRDDEFNDEKWHK